MPSSGSFGGCCRRARTPLEVTEIVRPRGLHPVRPNVAERVELLHWEVFMGCVSESYYPRLAFQVPGRVDPALVRSSLAEALLIHPGLAGRVFLHPEANFTGYLALTNDGVRFTTVVRTGTAPEVLEENDVPSFCDLPQRLSVMAGRAPVLTIKLTVFSGDGSMVIGMAVSHAVLDGTTWSPFIRDWGRAARGELDPKEEPAPLDRSGFRRPRRRMEDVVLEGYLPGEKIGFAYHRLMLIGRINDYKIHSGRYPHPVRPRIYFSNSQLASLKRAAMPTTSSAASGGVGEGGGNADGWVTTQEALAAHLIKSLARTLLPPGSAAPAHVGFILDARKAAGVPAASECGCGSTFPHNIRVERVMDKTLPQVAADLHKGLKEATSPERYTLRFQNQEALYFDEDHGYSELLKNRISRRQQRWPGDGKFKVALRINNLSKVKPLDFGTGGAQMFYPAGGPTLWVAAPPDGMLVFLDVRNFVDMEPSRMEEAMRYMSDVPTT